ncbi:MAG: hypothetical protein RMK99_12110 [Anaerolineales bacterium]|nr:hypothetical protein [Anaerolineales bacterium]
MRLRLFLTGLALGLSAMAWTACTSSGAGEDGAARAVERYLQAVVAGDTNRVATLVCAAWEADAITEADSFLGVKAELKDVSCTAGATDAGGTTVNCRGQILATYGNEVQTFELSERAYLAKKEAGEWRMCGYR